MFHSYSILFYRCFNDLKDHHEEIGNNPKLQIKIKEISLKLSELDVHLFSKEECGYKNIVHLLGVWWINAFSVKDEDETRNIGSALYVMSTCFDHACRPNAIKVFDDIFRIKVYNIRNYVTLKFVRINTRL